MVTVGNHVLQEWEADMLVAIYAYMSAQQEITPTPLPPAVRDLRDALGISSTNTVAKKIVKLRDEGYLVFDEKMEKISRASTRLTYKGHHVAWTLFREKELLSD